MSTYTQILYHIVFSTKNRERTLKKSGRIELFKYIWGILKKKNCHLYQINGVEDYIHIVTHLHPSVSLSSLVKDIKVSSNLFIRENNIFENFKGWQAGYGAFTYCINAKDNLVDYVKKQEVHHKKSTFKEEYIKLLSEHKIEFDEKYLL